ARRARRALLGRSPESLQNVDCFIAKKRACSTIPSHDSRSCESLLGIEWRSPRPAFPDQRTIDAASCSNGNHRGVKAQKSEVRCFSWQRKGTRKPPSSARLSDGGFSH